MLTKVRRALHEESKNCNQETENTRKYQKAARTIGEFSKVARHKINTQNQLHFYT